jgi:hypothetical protein
MHLWPKNFYFSDHNAREACVKGECKRSGRGILIYLTTLLKYLEYVQTDFYKCVIQIIHARSKRKSKVNLL